jgi:hypothetical protein
MTEPMTRERFLEWEKRQQLKIEELKTLQYQLGCHLDKMPDAVSKKNVYVFLEEKKYDLIREITATREKLLKAGIFRLKDL